MRSPFLFRLFPLLFLVFPLQGLSGCGAGDETLAVVDPEAVPLAPTFDEVFVIIQRSCVPCHGGASNGDKHAANDELPAGKVATEPGLDDCSQVVLYRFDILADILSDRMPNGAWPRLTSEEKLLIERWVENGAPAPCS